MGILALAMLLGWYGVQKRRWRRRIGEIDKFMEWDDSK
jgi:hypothetical protein